MTFKTVLHIAKNTAQALPALVFICTRKNEFICAVATTLSVYYLPKNSGQTQHLAHINPQTLQPLTTFA